MRPWDSRIDASRYAIVFASRLPSSSVSCYHKKPEDLSKKLVTRSLFPSARPPVDCLFDFPPRPACLVASNPAAERLSLYCFYCFFGIAARNEVPFVMPSGGAVRRVASVRSQTLIAVRSEREIYDRVLAQLPSIPVCREFLAKTVKKAGEESTSTRDDAARFYWREKRGAS